jgi:ketosteroid isomerase-like protein
MNNIDGATPGSTWEDEIYAVEEENRVAFLAADISTLDRMWTDDCAINSPVNRIHTKAQLFDLLPAGIVRHTSMEFEIERMDRHGDLVVVMGNDRVTDPPDSMMSYRRYTNLWRLEHRAWRLAARHTHVVSREMPGPTSGAGES